MTPKEKDDIINNLIAINSQLAATMRLQMHFIHHLVGNGALPVGPTRVAIVDAIKFLDEPGNPHAAKWSETWEQIRSSLPSPQR